MNTFSTQIDRAAYEAWRENSAEERARVAADPDRLAFHIQPEVGWLNDPNGLVQVNGIYHIYHQYNPFDAARGGATMWNHLSTQDFVHYRDHSPALFPDAASVRVVRAVLAKALRAVASITSIPETSSTPTATTMITCSQDARPTIFIW